MEVVAAPVNRFVSGDSATPVNGVDPSPERSPIAVVVSANVGLELERSRIRIVKRDSFVPEYRIFPPKLRCNDR